MSSPLLSLRAARRATWPALTESRRAGCPSWWPGTGPRARLRSSPARGGRNGFEHELRRLGVRQKNGKPNHPQTQGKVERLWQTLKKWLAAQHPQPVTLTELQALLDAFTSYYNTARPHRSLPHRQTPAAAYAARPKAAPGSRAADTHDQVRTDIVGTTGTVTLRHAGQLYHIGAGRTHAGTRILLLIQDLHVRIIDAATGELLRQLTLDPARNYQPTGRPSGPAPRTPANGRDPGPRRGFGVIPIS